MLKVSVLGTGYVGLVSGTCLAELGHDVVCIDTDADKIARLKAGISPIYEPGLEELIRANVDRSRLHFESSVEQGMASGVDLIFIAVGTPTESNGGGANLSYVFQAAADAARTVAAGANKPDDFTVVVTKSTVPVGTSRKVAAIFSQHLPPERFAVASNPEFLREGNAIKDFMEPDRIVFGSSSEAACERLKELYRPLSDAGHPLVITSTVETSELIKYAANAFLATKLTFVNELARLCEAAGADIHELTHGVGLDSRIGGTFFAAGPGFGGSCFPKDLMALIKTGTDFGSPVEIVETVIRANDRHKQLMVRKVRTALGGSLDGCRIGVLGLAFKANTDDMRSAPSLTIVPQLVAEGADVTAHDPAARHTAEPLLPGVKLVDSPADAIAGADAVVILTEWQEFQSLPWERLITTMRRPLIVDLRNLLDAQRMWDLGIDYWPLGRGSDDARLQAAAE